MYSWQGSAFPHEGRLAPNLRTIAGALRALVVACAAAAPVTAAAADAAREVLVVAVERDAQQLPVSVTLPCPSIPEADVENLAAAPNGHDPEGRAESLLEALSRLDPQRADDLQARLREVLASRRFVTATEMTAALGAGGPESTASMPGLELPLPAPAQHLEVLSARLRGPQSTGEALLVDEGLWRALDHGRQTAAVLLQAMTADAAATGAPQSPCGTIAALASRDLDGMSAGEYYTRVASFGRAAPPSPEMRRQVAFADLFRPLDEPVEEVESDLVEGFPIRKLALTRLGGRVELEHGFDETTSHYDTGDAESSVRDAGQRGFAGIDLEGYVYHPKIFMFGLTAGVWGELRTIESCPGGETETTDRRDVRPQIGFSAIGLRDQRTSWRAFYNKYHDESHAADVSFTVTDTDQWALGSRLRLKHVPLEIEIGRHATHERERVSGSRRDVEGPHVQVVARHAAGKSQTQLEARWESWDEDTLHVNGYTASQSTQREIRRLWAWNELEFKAQDGWLRTEVRDTVETGTRPADRLDASQIYFAKHSPKLLGQYQWEYHDLAIGIAGAKGTRTATWRASSEVTWRPTEELTVRGNATALKEDTGDFSSRQAGVGGDATWMRTFRRCRITASGGVAWLAVSEDGTTGLAAVVGEAHVLDGLAGDLLEQHDVVPETVRVTSADGGITYIEGVDYRLIDRDGLTELSRVETGSIPDGATVLADYSHALVLREPLDYTSPAARLSVIASFLQHLDVSVRWNTLQHDVNASERTATRFRNEDRFVARATGRWGRLRCLAEYETYETAGSSAGSYTRTRAELNDAWTLGLGQHVTAGGWYSQTDYDAGRDYDEWGVTATWTLQARGHWPSVFASVSYHPFDATDYSGEPYEGRVEALFAIKGFELEVEYDVNFRESEHESRERDVLLVTLRRQW